MIDYERYASALDELNSHLTPTQFNYLLNSLASFDKQGIKNESDYSESVPYSNTTAATEGPIIFDLNNFSKKNIIRSKFFHQNISSTESASKTSKRTESLLGSESWNSKDKNSLKALKAPSEPDIQGNVGLAVEKYDNLGQLETALYFKGAEGILKKGDFTFQAEKTCSELKVCKKLLKKFPQGLSRTSSTETVKAESLPDLDNPFVPIAGKIRNEPVNPFPYLKKNAKFKPLKVTKGHEERIEKELSRELGEDYKDLSKFFSRSNKNKSLLKSCKKPINLNKRVTNPLYKVYDPAGYHKTDEELATECIEKLCSDFNSWLKTLTNKSRAICEDKNDDNESQDDDAEEEKIEPEFLIRILRTELELPEESESLVLH